MVVVIDQLIRDICIHTSCNFQLVMSLLAMSLGLRFCASRKGRTEGGGQVSTLGPGSMAASGLCCRKPLVGTVWAISLLLCMNGWRKQSSGHVGSPFLAVKLFTHSVGMTMAKCRDNCVFVRRWVWFESQMCTGWLQWHLCEVRSFNTHWSGNMLCLEDP